MDSKKNTITIEQYERLKPYESIWIMFKKDQTMRALTHSDKQTLEKVYTELTGRTQNLYCSTCIVEMFTYLFSQFDKVVDFSKEMNVEVTAELNPLLCEQVNIKQHGKRKRIKS
jgi:hypothetical protein